MGDLGNGGQAEGLQCYQHCLSFFLPSYVFFSFSSDSRGTGEKKKNQDNSILHEPSSVQKPDGMAVPVHIPSTEVTSLFTVLFIIQKQTDIHSHIKILLK